jgi:pyruvate formate lyase activating enzyme
MAIRIKGFLETSFLDWPGKLAAVLFLPGCNFRCPYCHNHVLVTAPERLETIPLEYILRRLKGLRGWVDGICITGGEPTLNPELPLLLERIKGEGWAVKLDTNGSFPGRIRDLTEKHLVDCVAMDIKAPLDSTSYSRCAGVRVDIGAIRQSLSLLVKGGINYILRMTVVPALLTEEQIYETARQLVGAGRLLIQDFNPADPLSPELKGEKSYGEAMVLKMQTRVDAILDHEEHSLRQFPGVSTEHPFQQIRPNVP